MLLVVVEPCIARDLKHPGLEAALISKRLAILQHSEEDILNEFLSNRPAAGHAGEEIEESAMVAIEKDSEFRNIAVPNG